jgi:prevent-host-death family protein
MSKSPSIVGSRELKTRLGQYLARVRGGETILVTDRGKPVAELRPVGASNDETQEALLKMAAEGLVTLPAHGRGLTPFKPVRLRGGASASDAVSTDRDERG